MTTSYYVFFQREKKEIDDRIDVEVRLGLPMGSRELPGMNNTARTVPRAATSALKLAGVRLEHGGKQSCHQELEEWL